MAVGRSCGYWAGVAEVVGAAMWWLPRRQVLAASVVGGTMVGAVLAHVFILGAAPGIPAVVLGLICTVVIYLHRDQINETLGRSA